MLSGRRLAADLERYLDMYRRVSEVGDVVVGIESFKRPLMENAGIWVFIEIPRKIDELAGILNVRRDTRAIFDAAALHNRENHILFPLQLKFYDFTTN